MSTSNSFDDLDLVEGIWLMHCDYEGYHIECEVKRPTMVKTNLEYLRLV